MRLRSAFVPLFALAALSVRAADPTQTPDQLADALRAQLASAGRIEIRGLAVPAGGSGTAVLRLPDGAFRAVRAGDAFELEDAGVRVPFSVRGVDAGGVSLDAPSLPGGTFELRESFPAGAAEAPEGTLAAFVAEDLPLRLAARLLASATGENVVVSPAAGELPARLSLRGVPPATVVELLCSSLGLWRRPDPATGVPTILTLEEYERELASFREERTEAFTLLYPNVIEVASVLYGLFPDRVYLTLGEQGVLEDERNELSRRFNRFRMIDDALPSTGFAASSGGRVSVPGGSTSVFGYDDNRHDRTKDEPAGPATYSGLTREEAERLEAARASGDEEAARAVLAAHRDRPPSIFVTVSRRNNLVIVRTGDAEAMEQIRRLIRRLDVPTPTVLLEMKVMEFSVDDGFNSTFEYEFVTDTRSNGNDYRSEAGFPGFSPLSNAGRTDAFSYRLLSEHFNMRIQMLEKNGKARTIATPMLLVANNEVSRLFIGDEVPITTGVSLEPVTSTTSSGVTAVTGYTVEPETSIRSIGTTLLVTPSINADRTVTLHLLEEESSVIRNGGSIPYGDAQSLQSFSVDTVESRRVSGTFIAMDGLIAAVGGLIRETESEQESRIPVLGSIPLIGFLFRSTERVKERTELVIFIRPHVLSTPAEGERESRRLLETLSRSPDLGSVFEPAPLEPDGFRPADPVERVLEGRLAAEPPAPGPEAQTGDAAAR